LQEYARRQEAVAREFRQDALESAYRTTSPTVPTRPRYPPVSNTYNYQVGQRRPLQRHYAPPQGGAVTVWDTYEVRVTHPQGDHQERGYPHWVDPSQLVIPVKRRNPLILQVPLIFLG
jgi:hypothetical protein